MLRRQVALWSVACGLFVLLGSQGAHAGTRKAIALLRDGETLTVLQPQLWSSLDHLLHLTTPDGREVTAKADDVALIAVAGEAADGGASVRLASGETVTGRLPSEYASFVQGVLPVEGVTVWVRVRVLACRKVTFETDEGDYDPSMFRWRNDGWSADIGLTDGRRLHLDPGELWGEGETDTDVVWRTTISGVGTFESPIRQRQLLSAQGLQFDFGSHDLRVEPCFIERLVVQRQPGANGGPHARVVLVNGVAIDVPGWPPADGMTAVSGWEGDTHWAVDLRSVAEITFSTSEGTPRFRPPGGKDLGEIEVTKIDGTTVRIGPGCVVIRIPPNSLGQAAVGRGGGYVEVIPGWMPNREGGGDDLVARPNQCSALYWTYLVPGDPGSHGLCRRIAVYEGAEFRRQGDSWLLRFPDGSEAEGTFEPSQLVAIEDADEHRIPIEEIQAFRFEERRDEVLGNG